MSRSAPSSAVLDRVFATVQGRRGADPSSSYTAKLFSEGLSAIARKVDEEAVEVVVAAHSRGSDEVAAESADLLYHLMVLWAETGVVPAQVWAVLASREGTSGLAEKAARPRKPQP